MDSSHYIIYICLGECKNLISPTTEEKGKSDLYSVSRAALSLFLLTCICFLFSYKHCFYKNFIATIFPGYIFLLSKDYESASEME